MSRRDDLLTEAEWNSLVDAFCDLTYRSKQLTPFHADALVQISLPVIEAIVAARVAEAQAKAPEDAADDLVWVRPEVCPCTNPEACCGSESSCDAMRRHSKVVGESWLRARAAAPAKGASDG